MKHPPAVRPPSRKVGRGFLAALLLPILLGSAASSARATVAVSPLYGSNMVLQRDKAIPVRGTATPGRTITVSFNGQTVFTTADPEGKWQVTLAPMTAKAIGGTFTIGEAGGNTLTLTNVVIGDVWLCSGQSNMAWNLSGCDRPGDVGSANFPGLRHFWVPLANLGEPSKTLTGSWSVCSPSTAGGFSAVAFYFGRRIQLDQTNATPVGLIASTVGGTCIDPWLAPEGLTDIPALAPLYSQPILAWGPFSLFNGMIHPLAPFPVKGAIWYQGENRETTSQSVDSYFLKEKALARGWSRLFGEEDFAFYVVQLANWLEPATTVTPDGPGSWADTRAMQSMVLDLPHAGVASALDVGDAADIHPKDKFDVGERLALWALRNDYGRTNLVASGPVLRDVTVNGSTLVCAFDYTGTGLMAGHKTPYLPTQETNAPLARFVIAGSSGGWVAAVAAISNDTVIVSSPSVAAPRRVAYAYWTNPSGANLYNRQGLPALPFLVDDVTAKYTITASAGPGGAISPAGSRTWLKRATALYTIQPDPGYHVLDVRVDGFSVGAVRHFTFDPLYASHTISAVFTNARPAHTINASFGPGGTIVPQGGVSVLQDGAQTFSVTPRPGGQIALAVDGRPMGARDTFTFSSVSAGHSIAASFLFSIQASCGYGGSISSPGVTVLPYGSHQTYTITPASNYTVLKVMVDGVNIGPVSSYTFTNLTTNHVISASFSGGTAGGSVPRQSELLFSCLTDTLPASGAVNTWAGYIPATLALSKIGSPTVSVIDDRKFVLNNYYDGDGFNQGTYSTPIPCEGVSVVVVARPARNGVASGWNSIVDVFYDRLVLGIKNDTGQVCVRRNGSMDTSTAAIPDGQTTILSLVVQSNGTYKVWANGSLLYNNTIASPLRGLTNGVAGGFANNITVGRNWPDGWTTFNGWIGDVFFYKTVLSDAERLSLEQFLASRLVDGGGVPSFTITATAGPGGLITPAGAVLVASNATQSFTITPNTGFARTDLVVDGISRGPVSSWTFTNVAASHSISATFNPESSDLPRPGDLLFSCITDMLPASGPTGPWPTFMPSGQSLPVLGSPTVELIDGVKWEKNAYADQDGYSAGSYANPLVCNGVSIVAAVRPVHIAVGGEPRGEIVDLFYDRLALAVGHGDGRLMVARGYWNDWGPAIPSGQKTIVSLVVQPDGAYTAYTNGTQVMSGSAYGDFTSIPPDHTAAWGAQTPWPADYPWTHFINVGRNHPDGWSTFNGNIGDVFVYKAALSDPERQQLEARLAARFLFPPRPSLAIAPRPGGTVEITWPSSFSGPLLTSPVLGGAASWTPVATAPGQSNGLYRVMVSPGPAPAFFALGL